VSGQALQNNNSRWRRPPSWIFAQTLITQLLLQECSQLQQEIGDVTKSGNSNKFKMAAVET